MSQQDQNSQYIFVGRRYELDQYNEFLRGEETSWILFFLGIPGIGKSWLLGELKEHHTPPDVGIIHIDFDENRPYLFTDPLQVLEALAKQANNFCNENQYNAFINSLQKGRKQLRQVKKQPNKQREEIRDRVARAFYKQLDTLEKERLVFMLDTCERLDEPEGLEVGQWLIGELLPMLHLRMEQQGRRCLVVIASRVLLKSVVIHDQDQQLIDLSMLEEREINKYLEEAGITDNSIQERIREMTAGHPLSLELIRELWYPEYEKLASNDDEKIAKFQLEFNDKVSTKFVEKRILERLTSPYKELTEYGVLLRSFNLPQLKTIFPRLLSGPDASDVFDRFIRYPYIESLGGYRYTFHEFVRETLAKHIQKDHLEEWRQYHKKALDSITQGVGFPKEEPRSPEWYYHFIAFDETEGMEAWKEAIQQARDDTGIGLLLQAARDKALNLTLTSQLTLAEQEKEFYKNKGKAKEVEKSHSQVEKFRQEIKDLTKTAKDLQTKGDNQQEQGDLRATLESYNEALTLFQHIGNHSVDEEAGLKKAIEEIHHKTNLYSRQKTWITALSILIIIIILLSAFVPQIIDHFRFQLAIGKDGIGVTSVNGEDIGISDGRYALDTSRENRDAVALKIEASESLRNGNRDKALAEWNAAHEKDTSDAEPLIYAENRRVLASGSPYISIVLGVSLGVNVYDGFSRDALQGAYIVQRECNENPQLSGGKKLRLLIARSGSNPNQSQAIANQIVKAAQSDKTIVGVQGWTTSATTLNAVKTLADAHLTIIAADTANDELTGISPYFFRIGTPSNVSIHLKTTYIEKQLKSQRVVIFKDPNEPFSRNLSDNLVKQFAEDQYKNVFIEEFKTADEAIVTQQVQKALKTYKPDLLYITTNTVGDVRTLLNTIPATAEYADLKVFAGGAGYELVQDEKKPNGYTRMLFSSSAYPDEWPILAPENPTPPFFNDYSAVYDRHDQDPYTYRRANGEVMMDYDALYTFLVGSRIAIQQGKQNPTSEDIRNALSQINGSQSFQGITGAISFGPDGNPINKVHFILRVVDGGYNHLAAYRGCFLVSTECDNSIHILE